MLNRALQSTLFRFITVGAAVEILYIAVYSGLLISGLNVSQSILVAGSACITLNGYLQVKWSFRLKFRANLLLKFYIIQGICLATNIGIGELLTRLGVNSFVIGAFTLIIWGGMSFLLSRAIYNPDKASKGNC